MSGDLPVRRPRAPRGAPTADRIADAYKRPADDFLAAQADVVAPRRDMLSRLELTEEHARHVRPPAGADEAREPATLGPHPRPAVADRVSGDVPFTPEVGGDLPAPVRAEAEDDAAAPAVTYDAAEPRPVPEFKLPDAEPQVKKLPRALDADAKEE